MLSTLLNSLAKDQLLDLTKLKAIADDNINVAQMMISVSHRIRNIVGKGENAGYQHFRLLLLPQVKGPFTQIDYFKCWDCVVKS